MPNPALLPALTAGAIAEPTPIGELALLTALGLGAFNQDNQEGIFGGLDFDTALGLASTMMGRPMMSVQFPGNSQIDSPAQREPSLEDFVMQQPFVEAGQQGLIEDLPRHQQDLARFIPGMAQAELESLSTQLPGGQAPFQQNVVRSERPESGFFTKTEKAIEGSQQKVMTAEQARALISKSGKKDDIDPGVLEEYFKANPKVQKQDLLDFVRGNQTEVVTNVKGGEKLRDGGDPYENYNSYSNFLKEKYSDKYPGYNLSNLKSEGILTSEEIIILSNLNEGVAIDRSQDTKYSQYQLPGGVNYQETTFGLPQSTRNSIFKKTGKLLPFGEAQKQDFTSHAFDEPNTFGWMRTNDRTTAGGDEVLFVEEAQKVNSRTDNISEEQLRSLPQFARNGFTEFSVKQMVEKAVKEGKDVVAWTSGEQQADRYDLSKQIDELRYQKKENGLYDISIFNDGNNLTYDLNIPSNLKPEEIEKYVGKDVANRIIQDEGIGDEALGDEKALTGEQLKVGGESLKQFYDKNLPSVADKYINKLDSGAKVEEFDFIQPTGLNPDDVDFSDETSIGATKQKGFRITPKMRDKVLKEGQPLSFNIKDSSFPTVPVGGLA